MPVCERCGNDYHRTFVVEMAESGTSSTASSVPSRRWLPVAATARAR